jgi:hypothetical protein
MVASLVAVIAASAPGARTPRTCDATTWTAQPNGDKLAAYSDAAPLPQPPPYLGSHLIEQCDIGGSARREIKRLGALIAGQSATERERPFANASVSAAEADCIAESCLIRCNKRSQRRAVKRRHCDFTFRPRESG